MSTSKTLLRVITLSAMLTTPNVWSQTPPGTEQTEPFNYIGIHAGRHSLKEWPAEVNLGNNIRLPGSLNLDSRISFGVMLGRQYEKYRYEIELQEGRFDITDINLGRLSEPRDETGRYQAITLNAYRTRQLRERVTGFVGAGIGWGRTDLPEMGFTGGCQCFAEADASGFIWQLRAGVEGQITRKGYISVQYTRLFDVPGPASADQFPKTVYPYRNVGVWSMTFRRDFRRD